MFKQLNGLSVCAGGGLEDMGAHLAGIRTIFASEIKPAFADFHAINFRHPDGSPVVSVGDMRKLNMEDVLRVLKEKYADAESYIHFVHGGPSCQDYSRANIRKNSTGDDSRNWLVL